MGQQIVLVDHGTYLEFLFFYFSPSLSYSPSYERLFFFLLTII